MLDGRVKTLHPAVHAGILARNTESDLEDLKVEVQQPLLFIVKINRKFRCTYIIYNREHKKRWYFLEFNWQPFRQTVSSWSASSSVICIRSLMSSRIRQQPLNKRSRTSISVALLFCALRRKISSASPYSPTPTTTRRFARRCGLGIKF